MLLTGDTGPARRPGETKMKRRSYLTDEQGVTLVEIAVTVALIGIVATLAVPNIMGVLPRMALTSDATTLANTIALARASAISKNQYFAITFDDVNDSYSSKTWNISSDDTDADKVADWTEFKTAFTNTISARVDLYDIEDLGSDDSLVARPVGTVGMVDSGTREDFPLGAVGRIYLQTEDGMFKRRIIVDGLGRVYIEHLAPGVTVWTEE